MTAWDWFFGFGFYERGEGGFREWVIATGSASSLFVRCICQWPRLFFCIPFKMHKEGDIKVNGSHHGKKHYFLGSQFVTRRKSFFVCASA